MTSPEQGEGSTPTAGGAPAQPAVHFDQVPQALRDRAQWLLWLFELKDGEKKPRKVPYYVGGARRAGKQGDERDRARLVSFERVQQAFAAGGWSGVGFAFLPGDGLFGIDLDAAVDDDGNVHPKAASIVAACDSWTELSPSGKGLHVFMRGRTETHKVNAKDGRIGLEVFCESQFFTVTGRTWPGAPAQVREAGEKLLRKLHLTVDELKAAGSARPPAPPPAPAPRAPRDRAAELVEALGYVSAAGCSYDDWISIGMTLRVDLGDAAGFTEWDRWSALDADRYPGTAELARKWKSFRGDVQSGDLVFKLARSAGWKPRGRKGSTPTKQPAGGREEPPPEVYAGETAGGGAGDEDPPPKLGVGDNGRPRRFPFCNNNTGAPRGIRENVAWAMRYDPVLAGLVAFNEFSELHEITRTTPWRSEPGEWRAIDDLHLAEFLAHRHGLVVGDVKTIQQGVDLASQENKRHPLRSWLRSLQCLDEGWLDTWLIKLAGAADTPYVRSVGRKFLIGMVARIMRPGCKMDYALILQGRQGQGKSSLFRALAEPWFSDTPFRIGDRDAMMALQGVWLHEFSELESLAKSEQTAIKAFITSVVDRFRAPYGTRMLDVPRRLVFGGSTNAHEFLRDATGGRRFWPVAVGEIDVDGLKAIRDQLFAEAVKAFDAGERWYPTREEEERLFAPEQERWKSEDVWIDWLAAYVDSDQILKVDSDGDPIADRDQAANSERDFFSTQELMRNALKIEQGRIDGARQMQSRVAQCMASLGFTAGRGPDGKRKRGYYRPQPPASDPVLAPAAPELDAPLPADTRAAQLLNQGEVRL